MQSKGKGALVGVSPGNNTARSGWLGPGQGRGVVQEGFSKEVLQDQGAYAGANRAGVERGCAWKRE